jgi:hypothetical protein
MLTSVTESQVSSAISLLHFYGLVKVTKKAKVQKYESIPYSSSTFSFDSEGFDGSLTPRGLRIAQIVDVIHGTVWNALLIDAGFAFSCARSTIILASLFENSSKDSLWTFDAESSMSKQVAIWFGSVDIKSEHELLVKIYDEIFLPIHARDSKFEDYEKAGLSVFPWRDAHKDVSRAMKDLEVSGENEKKENLLEAVWEARRYHVAVKKNGVFETVGPLKSSNGNVDSLFLDSKKLESIVYEELVTMDSGTRLLGISQGPNIVSQPEKEKKKTKDTKNIKSSREDVRSARAVELSLWTSHWVAT